MWSFTDRVVLVTGAGRGIGAAIATRFARDGASVVVNDLDVDVAQSAVDEITAAGGTAVAVGGSVADPDAAAEIVAKAADTYGQLDVLVNNAGITRDQMMHKMTDDTWNLVVDVILKGTFNMTRAAAPLLRGSKDAPNTYHRKVVNIASTNGVYGLAANANYSAAKAGVIGLTKSNAREWARFKVNVNAVAPGYIGGTRMTSATDTETGLGMPSELIPKIESQIPIGRGGTPEDVAGACVWLASPDSDYCTGQVIELHGGREIIELV